MRGVGLDVRRLLRTIEDVVGAERYERDVRIARRSRRLANGDGVDLESARGFGLAQIDVVKGGRVHENVRSNSPQRVAQPFTLLDCELGVRRRDDFTIHPTLPNGRPELPGTANQQDALHTVDRRPAEFRCAISAIPTATAAAKFPTTMICTTVASVGWITATAPSVPNVQMKSGTVNARRWVA